MQGYYWRASTRKSYALTKKIDSWSSYSVWLFLLRFLFEYLFLQFKGVMMLLCEYNLLHALI
jgi:hypothetical protein